MPTKKTYSQAARVQEIFSKNTIPLESIKSIQVELTERAYDIVGQPQEIKFNPKNAVDGQFSTPYSVAIATLEKRALLDEYTDESVVRPDVNELMKKISVKHATDLDRFYPESFPARVTVTTNDEKTFVKEVRYPKGDPQSPLTWDDLVRKFDYCSKGFSKKQKKEQIVEMVKNLDRVENIADFTKLLK